MRTCWNNSVEHLRLKEKFALNAYTGDHYGEFELVFSEVEEEQRRVGYNPCYEFFNSKKSAQVYRNGVRTFAGTH